MLTQFVNGIKTAVNFLFVCVGVIENEAASLPRNGLFVHFESK